MSKGNGILRITFLKKLLSPAGIIAFSTALLFSCAMDKEAIQERIAAQKVKPVQAKIKPLPTTPPVFEKKSAGTPYLLGVEDMLDIKVINKTDLNTLQEVRKQEEVIKQLIFKEYKLT